ncbi:MAG: alpha-2-macroglobulin family protein, partial [Bacteroidota bacterium]
MKKILIIAITFLATLLPQKESFTQVSVNNYSEQWKQVEALKEKGLPRSAIEKVEQIYQQAQNEENHPQYLKALIYKLALKSEFEVNYNEASIKTILQELDNTDSEIREAILHSMLGELYWNYYRQNRFKISQRSQTNNENRDLSGWDIQTILQHAKQHHQKALSFKESLIKVDLSSLGAILDEPENTRELRPTAFDFVAYRALDFFQSPDYPLTKANLEIVFHDTSLFDDIDTFLEKDFSENPDKYVAFKVYQSLLKTHRNSPSALAEANLRRLAYVKENHAASRRQDLFTDALKQFAEKIQDSPEWSLAKYYLASSLYQGHDPVKIQQSYQEKNQDAKQALEYCNQAINAYPKSYGASKAKNLKKQILRKALSVSAETATLPKKAYPVSITYSNIRDVHFRVYQIDPDGIWNKARLSKEDQLEFLLRKDPQIFFSRTLSEQDRHISLSTELIFPKLNPGFYVLVASSAADFIPNNEVTTFAEFWVTDLALMSWDEDRGNMELTLVNRSDGKPVKRAELTALSRNYDYKTREYTFDTLKTFSTDRDGKLHLSHENLSAKSFYLDIRKGDDRYRSPSNFYLRKTTDRTRTNEQLYLFTDRKLYRPGQTIYFKGIALKEETNQPAEIMSGHKTTVELLDPNRQKVSKQAFTTNDYGSFNGTFILPDETMSGTFQLKTPDGSTTVTVEEYRRPRFKVEAEPLKGAYKLNETVVFKGKAEALAGYPIEGADVEYRVVRQPRFPFLRYIPMDPAPEITLKAGETTTKSDGTFEVPFVTEPDKTIPRQQKPVFHYRIDVKVTDKNGETHEKQSSIAAGYDSFIATVSVEDDVNRQKPLEIKPEVKNLSQENVNAEGVLTIHKLENFEKPFKDRLWNKPDEYQHPETEYALRLPHFPYGDNGNMRKLKPEAEVLKTGFYTTDSLFTKDISYWETGIYRVSFDVSKNRETQSDTAWFVVYDPDDRSMPVNRYAFFKADKTEALPGENVKILLGSAADRSEVHVRAEQNGECFFKDEITLRNRQKTFEIPVSKELRGGFTVHATFVNNNRMHTWKQRIEVPYENKKLDIRLETNQTPLTPGGKQEWTLYLKGNDEKMSAAEILAGMYDAALDEIQPLTPWNLQNLNPVFGSAQGWTARNDFSLASGKRLFVNTQPGIKSVDRVYPELNWFGYRHMDVNLNKVRAMRESSAKGTQQELMMVADNDEAKGTPSAESDQQDDGDELKVRSNFDETAFFYPQLMSDKDSVEITFTLPESLTEWKFMALAHTKDLKTGQLVKRFKASKELMVVPNPPRFVRENDRFSFAAKVVNMSDEAQEITVELQLIDATTNTQVTETLGLKNHQRKLTLPAGESRDITFPLQINMKAGLLKYRITASGDTFTDGKEDFLPVLTNRKLLTETNAFSMNKPGEKTIKVPSFDAGNAERLTFEYTANATWYAVQALPFLENKNSKSASAIAHTLYANSLGEKIVTENPEIEEVFSLWKKQDQEALLSELEKNQELKNVLIDHTPWLLEARDESENKQRVALFFDANTLQYQKSRALEKLSEQQNGDGGWSWRPGMPSNQYITQNILTQLAALQEMGMLDDRSTASMMKQAVEFVSQKTKERYERLRKQDDFEPENYKPTHTEVYYLYTLSLLKDHTLSAEAKEIVQEYRNQTEKFHTEYNKYMQGMIAMMHYNNGNEVVSKSIVNSLREHALWTEDGMHWRFDGGWHWYQAPIEFQALMIRLFDKVGDVDEDVENLKLWLLKQKQTQKWPTSSATAEAVYALLSTGSDMLTTDMEKLKIKVGEQTLETSSGQAGTGYIKQSWEGPQIKPKMHEVSIDKKDENVSWGAVYHQYFENLENIESHAEGVSVRKKLFIVNNTEEGEKLVAVSDENPIRVGDKLRIHLTLTSDKNLDFVHLEDGFASGFEAPEQLSGYRYQDGLVYYRSMKDASAEFFIQRMQKGTYVLEYDVIAEQSGNFSLGIATLQSLYAPEFAAHSDG